MSGRANLRRRMGGLLVDDDLGTLASARGLLREDLLAEAHYHDVAVIKPIACEEPGLGSRRLGTAEPLRRAQRRSASCPSPRAPAATVQRCATASPSPRRSSRASPVPRISPPLAGHSHRHVEREHGRVGRPADRLHQGAARVGRPRSGIREGSVGSRAPGRRLPLPVPEVTPLSIAAGAPQVAAVARPHERSFP